jgi:DNA polymerase I
MNTYRLVAADYKVQDGRPYVWLFGRDSLGNKEVFSVAHTPYAYVPQEEANSDYPPVRAIDGRMVKRVDARIPNEIADYEKKYTKVYEDKILFPMRFLVDRGIRHAFTVDGGVIRPATEEEEREVDGVKLVTAFVDTESEIVFNKEDNTWSTIQDVQKGKNLTLCVTTAFSNDKELITYDARDDRQEKVMWKYWIDLMVKKDPDIIAGWNIAGHDLRVFYERCLRLKLNPNLISPMGYMSLREHKGGIEGRINGINTFEMRDAFKKFFQGRTFDSYALKPIAADKQIFGEFAIDEEDFKDLNVPHMEDVVKYNRRDVQRLINIEEVLHLIDQFDGISKVAGCSLFDTIDTSKYSDALFLREFHNKFVLGTKQYHKREKYQGAMVLTPQRGIYENVVALDFSGMYPTIIMSYNMSPETLANGTDNNVHNIGGIYFKKSPFGIVPNSIKRMMNFRKSIKKEMKKFEVGTLAYKVLDYRQYGIKQMIAAMYGYFAFPMGRMYYPQISSSVTFCGRKNIMSCVDFIHKLGYKVLYGDTDSMLIQVGDISEGEELEKKVNGFLVELAQREGLTEPPTIEYEIGYRRLLLGKKKRYAGLCTHYKGRDSDLIVIKGFEAKRSDSSRFSRNLQTEILGKILRGAPEKEISDSVKKVWKEFDLNDYPWWELGIPHKLSRAPEFYPHAGAGYLAEIYANTFLGKKFVEGTRPFIYWIRRVLEGLPPRIYHNGKWKPLERIALDTEEDFRKWVPYIDWEMQKHKIIERKLELILSAWGKSLGEIVSDQKQQTLF